MSDYLDSAVSLVQVLHRQSRTPCQISLISAGDQETLVTFQELYARAQMLLHHLQERGLRRGDELILLLADNRQFLELFWACLLGGIVPVPLAVGTSDEQRYKVFRVYRQLQNPYLCTTHTVFERFTEFSRREGLDEELSQIRKNTLLTDSLHAITAGGAIVDVSLDDVAFIQFSSGSTSDPKGVVLTHGNLLANIRDIIAAARFTSEDVSLSWMPLTHDMGLIGFHINMLCAGMDHCLMDTELFIRRPLLWLQTASAKKATVLCSPNFGYRHFLKMFDKKGLDKQVDLSSVRLVFNGAEPISPQLCQEFTHKLAPYGLRSDAMFPVYGLAEATLAVTFPEVGRPVLTRWLDRGCSAIGDVVSVADERQAAIGVVAVGHALEHCALKIADAQGVTMPGGTVGRILIKGPNVTSGYYRQPELTQDLIDSAGWLDTGDLGVMLDGELYITGRSKDLIFVNGQNFYAHDLENVLQEVAGLELGKVVAGAVQKAGEEQEQLVVFVLYRGDANSFLTMRNEIVRVIGEHTGAAVAEVVPVKNVPKTTSGKIQRYLLTQAYLKGDYDEVRAQLAELDGVPVRARAENTVEEELLAICAQVLGEQRLGPEDNFFELGTNSLKLIQVHTLIDERYPGLLELADMFDYPTIRDLAAFISKKHHARAAAS